MRIKFHKKYLKELEAPVETEAYMITVVLRKTLELISLNRRRGVEECAIH